MKNFSLNGRLLLLLPAVVLACSDDEEAGPDVTTDPSTDRVADFDMAADPDLVGDTELAEEFDLPPQSGEVTFVVDDLTGQNGRVLLSFISPPGGGPQSAVAGTCDPIDSDPFDLAAVMRQHTGDNPCELGDPVTIEPGQYEVFAGAYVGGEQTPRLHVTFAVEVNGDTDAIAPDPTTWDSESE